MEDEYAFEIIDESGQRITVATNEDGNVPLVLEDGTDAEILTAEA